MKFLGLVVVILGFVAWKHDYFVKPQPDAVQSQVKEAHESIGDGFHAATANDLTAMRSDDLAASKQAVADFNQKRLVAEALREQLRDPRSTIASTKPREGPGNAKEMEISPAWKPSPVGGPGVYVTYKPVKAEVRILTKEGVETTLVPKIGTNDPRDYAKAITGHPYEFELLGDIHLIVEKEFENGFIVRVKPL